MPLANWQDWSSRLPSFFFRELSTLQWGPRCILLLGLATASSTWAGDEALTERPPPATPQEVTTPMEESFEPRLPPEHNAIRETLDKSLEYMTPFVRDSQLTLKLRTYYFDNDPFDGKKGPAAWAGGGSAAYTSGWLVDRFRVGAEWFTSQPIYAPEDRDGTLLLAPGQQGYSVWGQLYGQFKIIDDTVLTGGKSEYNTPYVNPQFNRMTPNTFEGVSLKGSMAGLQTTGKVDYLVGYLSQVKLRNSDQFIPMSQALGTADKYYGTGLAEIKYSVGPVSAGVAEYYTPQNLNILYTELTWAPEFGSKYGLKLSWQYSNQRSIGTAPSLNGEPLHSNTGGRASFGYAGIVLGVAYTYTTSDGNLISPWGSNPSYTNALIRTKNRAGEEAALAKASYDFGKVGVAGLSGSVVFAYYWSAVNPSTQASLPDNRELDLTLDYRVQKTMFKGLWLRVQRMFLNEPGEPEPTNEWRVILNWEIPLI
jgi:hypothetical protein